MNSDRQVVLRATLGFLALEPRATELWLLHRWLDAWRGVGEILRDMKRHVPRDERGAIRKAIGQSSSSLDNDNK